MPLSFRLLLKVLAAAEYGDLIAALHNQVKPYEINKGDAAACVAKWTAQVQDWLNHNKNYTIFSMKRRFKDIANDFAKIPVNRTPKVKVGVVGEIYVKFSPMGNNDLVAFLESQDCEVNMPGLMGYIEYCVANATLDVQIYGGPFVKRKVADLILAFLDNIGIAMAKAMESAGFHGPMSFKELMKKPDGILSLGVKMGEGWLLTSEMIELIETGYENIVCAQPFGCLPNHIAGKGVVNRIRAKYPNANITAVDYDPSATKVNQENRIKLMLSVAKERLNQKNKSTEL